MNKEAKYVVSKLTGRKYKVIFVMMWVTLAMYIVPPFIISADYSGMSYLSFIILLIISMLSGIAFLIISAAYYVGAVSAKKSVKTLVRTNKLAYANEILSGDYNSNGRVGFSEHLLYDKMTNILVAYDDIVWVYKRTKGKRTIEVIFCTVDGRKHGSAIDDITLNEFLKRRRKILVGFTPQNKLAYENKVKEYNAQERGLSNL